MVFDLCIDLNFTYHIPVIHVIVAIVLHYYEIKIDYLLDQNCWLIVTIVNVLIEIPEAQLATFLLVASNFLLI